MRSDGVRFPSRIVVVGVPGSRRVSAFLGDALRLGLGPVDVVSYLDWIDGCSGPLPSGALVRIESPSECSLTTRAILKAGIAPIEARGGVPISEPEIDRLACDRGEMLHPRQWFFGYQEILTRMSDRWSAGDIRWLSRPSAILTAFDKLACLELWSQAGLPVPRRFPGIETYSQLRREISDPHARIMVKLRYGYSAMGAVALEWRGPLVRAITTMEISSGDRPRLFVTKRPRVLTNELEIAWLIDRLAEEGVLVEEWLPKARWNGRPYDVRAVVIGGKLKHAVGRSSDSPFTNLNLDAMRISREEVEGHLGASWEHFETLCEKAARLLPGAGVLGLDVLARPCRRRFAILEANAFGDYLPGLMHRGQSIYQTVLSEFCRVEDRVMA
jgi:glutathione synthase/RimK-type ligase-like ATP-grasp enzyme